MPKNRSVRPARTGATARALALTALLASALSLAVALVLLPTAPVEGATAGVDVTGAEVDVTPQEFVDPETVKASATLSDGWTVTSSTSGVLRASTCSAGGAIESGTIVALVDDESLLALHTDSPLWRDLARGSHGDDVASLQRELDRLGYGPLDDNGWYNSATASAVRALWAAAGVEGNGSTIPVAAITWLPQTSVTVDECPAVVGLQISTGTPLAVSSATLTSLTVDLPEDLEGGDRVAITGDVSTPVGDGGSITDAAFLAAFTQTPRFDAFLEDTSAGTTVDIQLADPLDAVAVPASALYGVSADEACVLSAGTPVAVRIVASEFGQSIVTADPLPTSVQIAPDQDSSPCR